MILLTIKTKIALTIFFNLFEKKNIWKGKEFYLTVGSYRRNIGAIVQFVECFHIYKYLIKLFTSLDNDCTNISDISENLHEQ